jgi:hypothetical protein
MSVWFNYRLVVKKLIGTKQKIQFLSSSRGNESDTGSANCCICSFIFGLKILTFPKYQLLIPTKKLNFVLVEKLVLLAAALLPHRKHLYQIMIPT